MTKGSIVENTPFVIERTFDAPPEKIWKALTDKNEMRKWYFDIADFKPEVGFEFQFTGGTDTKTYNHLCQVTDVVPGKRLAYSWRYDGYEGLSEVIFELFGEGSQTRLKLTHRGLDTFPSDNPDLAAQNFAEGWAGIIGGSLKKYVEIE